MFSYHLSFCWGVYVLFLQDDEQVTFILTGTTLEWVSFNGEAGSLNVTLVGFFDTSMGATLQDGSRSACF